MCVLSDCASRGHLCDSTAFLSIILQQYTNRNVETADRISKIFCVDYHMSDWNLLDHSIVFTRWRHIPRLLAQCAARSGPVAPSCNLGGPRYNWYAWQLVASSTISRPNWASLKSCPRENLACRFPVSYIFCMILMFMQLQPTHCDRVFTVLCSCMLLLVVC